MAAELLRVPITRSILNLGVLELLVASSCEGIHTLKDEHDDK